jgi:hypothetical protein
MARTLTRPLDAAFIRRSEAYADHADFVFAKAFASDGIAADSMDATEGVTMADRVALGVVCKAASNEGRRMNGLDAVRIAQANGHVFTSARMADYGATVAADSAPVPRDTDLIGTFERPRKVRPLSDRLALYTPSETAQRVRHHEIIDSFEAALMGDDGEAIPVTQPPKILVSDPADLYVLGYERATTWSPLGGTGHVNMARRESMDAESLRDTIERLLLQGHAGVPGLRSLASSPETLAVLRHNAASGVTYNPASVAEQDGMINDFIAFLDEVMVSNDAAFTPPDTMFIGYQAWADTSKSARASSLDTTSQASLIRELESRRITAVPTPGIGRRAVVTRTAGEMSALIRIGDAAPRLLHTYTDRSGTHSVIGMRFGGLYSVYGAETCVTDLPE